MNYGRSVVVAGILLLSATLAACGGGSDAADATSQASAPVVGNRGAALQGSSTTTTAAATSAPASTTTTTAAHVTTSTVPATTASAEPQALTLTWTAPDDNTDGTPLVDLSGYKIRYGTSSGSYTQTVTLSNAGLNRFVVENLASGTYYFTISAYNRAGIESPLSGEVSTTL